MGGGELTWQAGPLRANGEPLSRSAGNGFALRRLFERSGDETWLERARAFALHAIWHVREAHRARGRYSLFTSDAGVTLYLAACLSGDPRFPVLDG